jgi:hypothetical protein
VLPQPAWGIFIFFKYLNTMCSDGLALREDTSTFGVLDLCKYCQDFVKFVGIDIATAHFFKVNWQKMS